MVDLRAIRLFINESTAEHHQLLTKIADIKILIQSINSVLGKPGVIRTQTEDINPITGSISFSLLALPDSVSQMTRAVLYDDDRIIE